MQLQNDCFIITNCIRVVSNRVLLKHTSVTIPVEWAYCFDIHLNAFIPMAVLVYGIQLICWPCKKPCTILISQ